MLHEAPIAGQKAPHVIVVGNEKGGSGKTTIAMHVAVALLKDGQRVGTIDLDSNQKSFTHYIENRRIWAQHRGIELEIPAHRHIPRVERGQLDMNEAEELAAFEAAVSSFDPSVEPLLQPEVRGHMLYLAREAISNVLRHAYATSARIESGPSSA